MKNVATRSYRTPGKLHRNSLASLPRPTPRNSGNGAYSRADSDAKRVFAIRANEDWEVILLWETHILPALPALLTSTIGRDHSADILRRGSCKENAQAFIQVQSPWMPSQEVKRKVRDSINHLCALRGHAQIPVRFLRGEMDLLVDSDVSDESGNEEEEECVAFSWFKSHWAKPGMGASIGPLTQAGEIRRSATLGGYVLVDQDTYMLTIAHFMPNEERTKVTSPSLQDLDDIRGGLEQGIRNIKARMEERLNVGDRDIPLEEIKSLVSPEDEVSRKILETLEALLDEHKQNDQDYMFGDIVHRCKSKTRRLIGFGPQFRRMPEDTDKIRMDWALCKVPPQRLGENRHRFREGPSPGEVDLSSDGDGKGAGDICTEACDLEPNAPVWYDGRKSGRRCGEVNGTLTLVTKDGVSTTECSVILSGGKLDKAEFEGDSGAWVINSKGKVVAQVYGYYEGSLLCSPIKEIFEDIKEVTGALTVGLPKDHNGNRPVAEYAEVCQIHDGKPKKHKAFDFKTVPRLLRKAPLLPKLVGMEPMSGPSIDQALASKPVSTLEVPVSHVPSLVSSRSTSPGPDPISPLPCSHDNSSNSDVLVAGSQPPSPSIEAQQSSSSDTKGRGSNNIVLQSKATGQALRENFENLLKGNTAYSNKHSIEFLLCANSLKPHKLPAAVSHHEEQDALRLERRASTFPMFKTRLRKRMPSLNLDGLSLARQISSMVAA